jgi:capsular polysaccharide biosynthesis protein
MILPSLPKERVVRSLPQNLVPEDLPLFAHEMEKTFGGATSTEGNWDFTPEGLLLAPGSSLVVGLSFQGTSPEGLLSRWKVRAKGLRARWFHPCEVPVLSVGTRPLIVTDEFSNGYFHWIADALPKIWWVKDRLDEFTLILPAFAQKYRYMNESLALWPGLRTLIVGENRRTALRGALVLPSQAPTGNYRPAFVTGLGSDWRAFLGTGRPHRKVYVSRQKAPWRKVRNEDVVWSRLHSQGFERVFLEDLPFAEQVRLLAETEVLVSNHGAGLTNLLFMVPGTRVLEVRMRGDAANNCYFSLASAVGLEYFYLLADPLPGQSDSHTADLIVDPVALDQVLEAML